MKLKEYMGTHEGEYWIAETTRPITAENLGGTLGDLEVEPHLLGADAIGRRRIHLYGTDRPFHIVTHVESGETSTTTRSG